MIEVSLNAEGVISTLRDMEKQLKEFPEHMGETLTTWQTEDMHRRFPNTTASENSVETEIWPTSRFAERDTKKIQVALRAHRDARKSFLRVKGVRPILRPQLYEKLVKRMDELMNKALAWKVD